MTTNKILISGASISAGYGLNDERNDTKLWINQILTQLYQTFNFINISETGADNLEIFLTTADQLTKEHYDLIVVTWQTTPRVNLNFGLEMYNTKASILSPGKCSDINLVAGNLVSGKTLDRGREYLLKFYNYHWDIKQLVSYVNILCQLAGSSKIVFVNYLQPWKTCKYFDQKIWRVPTELDEFTQELLEVNLRDDEEIRKLYEMCHRQYELAGGIQESHWLNLYTPLRLIQIDTISTNLHPGYLSQDAFAKYLTPILQKRLECL